MSRLTDLNTTKSIFVIDNYRYYECVTVFWKINFQKQKKLNNFKCSFAPLAPVVQKLDSAIHRINHYPVENAIGFPNTYPLDSDLSGGQPYPTFEQLGPDKSLSRG